MQPYGDFLALQCTQRVSTRTVERVRLRLVDALLADLVVVDPQKGKRRAFERAVEDVAPVVVCKSRRVIGSVRQGA